MISEYDVIKHVKKDISEGKLANFDIIEIDNVKWIIKRMPNLAKPLKVSSIPELTKLLRKSNHCDFDCIYDDHVCCSNILKCNECGTVIFNHYDEDDDPLLRCPTCGGYNSHFDFWTKEEIGSSEEKQKIISFYEQQMVLEMERDKRYLARGKLYDNELWKHTWYTKNGGVKLEFNIDSITNKWKLKHLRLNLVLLKKDGEIYIHSKWYMIPLSPYMFYIKYISPHTKKNRQ